MSTLVIDTIQGKTTAGSVNVRGEGSNNTNLQQGLAKCWVGILNKSAVSKGDSLNVASLTDPGTGRIQITYTTNMSNATYAVALGEGGNYPYQGKVISTSQAEHGSVTNGGNYTDSTVGSLVIHGDLA